MGKIKFEEPEPTTVKVHFAIGAGPVGEIDNQHTIYGHENVFRAAGSQWWFNAAELREIADRLEA